MVSKNGGELCKDNLAKLDNTENNRLQPEHVTTQASFTVFGKQAAALLALIRLSVTLQKNL